MEKGGASFFYHVDGLGSITELTDTAGTVAQSYTYSSFGKIESQLDSNFVQPYTFTGREFDSETGLYFYRARFYDSNIGRFLQQDPFPGRRLLPQTLNRYPYVLNDPVNWVDPWGLWKITLTLYTPFYGLGGGITFGTNPDGLPFGTLRLGIGVGGGISYDPDGTSPGYDPCDNFDYYGGRTIGGYGEAGVAFRGIGASLDVEGGYVFTPGGETDHPYFGITPNIVGNSAWRYQFGAGAGFEFGVIN